MGDGCAASAQRLRGNIRGQDLELIVTEDRSFSPNRASPSQVAPCEIAIGQIRDKMEGMFG